MCIELQRSDDLLQCVLHLDCFAAQLHVHKGVSRRSGSVWHAWVLQRLFICHVFESRSVKIMHHVIFNRHQATAMTSVNCTVTGVPTAARLSDSLSAPIIRFWKAASAARLASSTTPDNPSTHRNGRSVVYWIAAVLWLSQTAGDGSCASSAKYITYSASIIRQIARFRAKHTVHWRQVGGLPNARHLVSKLLP